MHCDELLGNSGIAESFIFVRVLYSTVLIINVIKGRMFIRNLYINSPLVAVLNNVFPCTMCRYYYI